MQITIKSAKVGKTGTSKQGDWELIIVTSEDGTDYATFEKSAKNLLPGVVIDIGEPIIKEGKCSFKEYTVISTPATSTPTTTPNSKPQMTPADWERKEKLEQWSREANACYMGLPALLACCPEGKAKVVWEAALDYALAHFNGTVPASRKAVEPKPVVTKPTEPSEVIEVALFTAQDLYEQIKEKMGWKNTAPVRSWLVNKAGIEETRIDSEPEIVYQEVKEIQGWD